MHDKKLIADKLDRWEVFMRSYHLPTWNELPDIPLYVDQIVTLTAKYLSFIPNPDEESQFITTSVVNNYVRMKLMPPPEKKRYRRRHLVYLIMICCLKQSLPMSQIQRIVPIDIDEQTLCETYNTFAYTVHATKLAFIEQVRAAAKTMNDKNATDKDAEQFVLSAAVSSVLYCVLTEKLLRLPAKSISN